MNIYHYSSKPGLNTLKVKYFGANAYTARDARICGTRRVYFTARKEPPEYRFAECHCYVSRIDKRRIYTITGSEDCAVHTLIRRLKRKKYVGMQYGSTIAIWIDIPCKSAR